MKGYIKGLITGLLIGAAMTAIPAVAENIDALFNEVRININGVDRVQWGENMKLSGGAEAPSSILYNGTTYLPLRKLGEILNKNIYWNGDSKTVSVTDRSGNEKLIAEKPDKYGNVWKYYITENLKDNYTGYLRVEDTARGYERVYLIEGNAVKVTDTSIYFVRAESTSQMYYKTGHLVRLDFENDENTQDGEILTSIFPMDCGRVLFEGDYVYCLGIETHAAKSKEYLTACNIITCKGDKECLTQSQWDVVSNLRVIEDTGETVTLTFEISGPESSSGRIVLDKTTNTFVR